MTATDLPVERFAHWLAFGQRGLSSKAIMHAAIGHEPKRGFGYPHDPDDFRRCELLLEAVPEARNYMPRLGEHHAVWAALLERWDEIAGLFADEAPDHATSRGWSAPRTYRLMRQIIDEAWEVHRERSS